MNITRPNLISLIFVLWASAGCAPAATAPAAVDCDDGPVTAFSQVHVVPMTAEIVLEDQTLLVQNGAIAALGPATDIAIPDCATVIESEGAYLMPGLADMHVHIWEESLTGWPVSPLALYIAHGVTTVRDSGANPAVGGRDGSFVLDLRQRIAVGELTGPTIYSPGLIIKESARRPAAEVQARVDKGFDYIKLYPGLTAAALEELMAAAAKSNLYTVGHIPYTTGLERAIELGLDEVAHVEEIGFEMPLAAARPAHPPSQELWLDLVLSGLRKIEGIEAGFDAAAYRRVYGDALQEVIQLLLDNDIAVTTTVGLSEVVEQKVLDPDAYLARPDVAYLPGWHAEEVATGVDKHQMIYAGIEELAVWKTGYDHFLLAELHEAGVPLVLGTDAGPGHIGVVAGRSAHDELRVLTENGFTPYEALSAATIDAAQVIEAMTGAADFGTVEAGKRADLLLARGNPLEDVSHARDIAGVMAAGRWYPAEALTELARLKGED